MGKALILDHWYLILEKKLDSGAYLTSLRREAIGYYTVNDALDIEMATDYIEKATQDILK